jgi:Lar family restriction alleviation protein
VNVWHVYIRRDGTIATLEDIAKERAAKRAEEERKRREAEEREKGRPRADILPCPFCGGEARIRENRSRAEEGTILYAVSCVDEDCPGYSFMPDGDAPEDEDAAVRKWNRRKKAARANRKGGKA